MNHARTATAVANWVVRPAGMTLVVLGLLFWSGKALALVPVHMLLGLVFVLSLWALAALAALAGVPRAAVAGVVLWGALVVALGVTQGRLLPGPMHWVVRVLHLVVGVAAMELARRLVARTRARAADAPAAAVRSRAA